MGKSINSVIKIYCHTKFCKPRSAVLFAHVYFVWLSKWTLHEGCITASEYDPWSRSCLRQVLQRGRLLQVPRLNADVRGVVCFQTRPAGTSKQRWCRASNGTASGNSRPLMTNFSVMSCEVVGTMFWRSIVLPSSGYKMEATVHGVILGFWRALRHCSASWRRRWTTADLGRM